MLDNLHNNIPVVADVHDPLLALDLLAAPWLDGHEVVDLGQGAGPPRYLAVHQLDQHHLDGSTSITAYSTLSSHKLVQQI